MADMQSLVDRIFYTNRRKYTHLDGEIAYLDGSPLRRPFSMPRTQKLIAFIIVLIAIGLAAFFFNNTVVANMRESAEAEQRVAENLERPASSETVPVMSLMINASNESIVSAFGGAGYTIYDASDPNDSTNIVLYKLPVDVGLEDAAMMYAKGVSNLSAVQATKLLNGSWYFSADRNGVNTVVVRYADFTTGEPVKAVQSALKQQGIDVNSITESGVDDAGNTYCQGTLTADGTNCIWKVSALPLEDMYSIKGLPEKACYVGVRITAQ